MQLKKICVSVLLLLFVSVSQCFVLADESLASKAEEKEYRQELEKLISMRKSIQLEVADPKTFKGDKDAYIRQLIAQKSNVDLKDYEKMADEVHTKWSSKNKEYHARLMLEVCGPLTSGGFKDKRSYDLSRKYALLALDDPNDIPVLLEQDLALKVTIFMRKPISSNEEDITKVRKKDLDVWLHAWKRLVDAIDPAWDPNEEMMTANAVAVRMGLPGAVDSQSIKDPVFRAKYEAAIEANYKKLVEYNEQYKLRMCLDIQPVVFERNIINAYSKPPYNNKELKKYLEDYKIDEKIKTRIIDAVNKNIEQAEKVKVSN